MLDTVKLHFREIELLDDCCLQVVSGPIDISTGAIVADYPLGTTRSGKTIFGQRAYFNHELFSLDIRNWGDGPQFFVTFSAPKVLHGDNFRQLSEEEIVAAFGSVRRLLQAEGIFADIGKARLSRLDIFQNVETRYQPETYFELLSHLRFNRMRSQSYPTTWTWGNRQWELAVYDKIAERNVSITLRHFGE